MLPVDNDSNTIIPSNTKTPSNKLRYIYIYICTCNRKYIYPPIRPPFFAISRLIQIMMCSS